MDFEAQFIGDVWATIDDERLAQKLTLREFAARIGVRRTRYEQSRREQLNMKLNTVAKMAHVMGKRAILVLVDEVPE